MKFDMDEQVNWSGGIYNQANTGHLVKAVDNSYLFGYCGFTSTQVLTALGIRCERLAQGPGGQLNSKPTKLGGKKF